LQIQTVLNKFQTARVINQDVLDLPFVLLNTNCALRCQFPPGFPQQAPAIFLLGLQNVSHSMLGNNNLVLFPKLQRWGPHSILANFLAEILQIFTTDPPSSSGSNTLSNTSINVFQQQPLQQQQQQQQNLSNSNVNVFQQQQQILQQQQQANQYQQQQQQQQQEQAKKSKFIGLTTIPTTFPELSLLDDKQLKELLNDDQAFDKFFRDLEVVKNLTNIYVDTKRENDAMAQKTLEREKTYQQTMQELDQVKLELKRVGDEYDKKVQIYQEKQRQKTPQYLQQEMKKLIQESDDKANAIAEEYLRLGKEAQVADFLKAFLEERQRYYVRMAKLERATKR
jgi:hypothetical protein